VRLLFVVAMDRRIVGSIAVCCDGLMVRGDESIVRSAVAVCCDAGRRPSMGSRLCVCESRVVGSRLCVCVSRVFVGLGCLVDKHVWLA